MIYQLKLDIDGYHLAHLLQAASRAAKVWAGADNELGRGIIGLIAELAGELPLGMNDEITAKLKLTPDEIATLRILLSTMRASTRGQGDAEEAVFAKLEQDVRLYFESIEAVRRMHDENAGEC